MARWGLFHVNYPICSIVYHSSKVKAGEKLHTKPAGFSHGASDWHNVLPVRFVFPFVTSGACCAVCFLVLNTFFFITVLIKTHQHDPPLLANNEHRAKSCFHQTARASWAQRPGWKQQWRRRIDLDLTPSADSRRMPADLISLIAFAQVASGRLVPRSGKQLLCSPTANYNNRRGQKKFVRQQQSVKTMPRLWRNKKKRKNNEKRREWIPYTSYRSILRLKQVDSNVPIVVSFPKCPKWSDQRNDEPLMLRPGMNTGRTHDAARRFGDSQGDVTPDGDYWWEDAPPPSPPPSLRPPRPSSFFHWSRLDTRDNARIIVNIIRELIRWADFDKDDCSYYECDWSLRIAGPMSRCCQVICCQIRVSDSTHYIAKSGMILIITPQSDLSSGFSEK